MVDEESLVEIELVVHLSSIILVEHPDVFMQVALIVYSMQTLAWPHVAEVIPIGVLLITDANIA